MCRSKKEEKQNTTRRKQETYTRKQKKRKKSTKEGRWRWGKKERERLTLRNLMQKSSCPKNGYTSLEKSFSG